MQSLQYIREHVRKISPFRWLLLLWIGFVYLWGVLWRGGMSEQITPHALILFTLLMLLHIGLYGVSSFTLSPSGRFRLLYFAIQALLIVRPSTALRCPKCLLKPWVSIARVPLGASFAACSV